MKLELPKGPLAEADIRRIVREAETGMADGADPKELLVTATQMHLASHLSGVIKAKAREIAEMAEMVGTGLDGCDFSPALPEGVAIDVLGDLAAFANDPDAGSFAAAKAFVTLKPVLPMNRGKWLAKFGIVKAHIEAIGSPSAPRAQTDIGKTIGLDSGDIPITAPVADYGATGFAGGPIDVSEAPDVTDPEMREMLGYAPLPAAEAPAGPLAFGTAPGVAPSAAALPTAPTPDASSAAPGSPPPPPTGSVRDAFMLVSQACDIQDAELAKRLAISRSTMHNYLGGRTGRVKCDQAQARVMAAECDRRVALLREAAEIFGQVRD